MTPCPRTTPWNICDIPAPNNYTQSAEDQPAAVASWTSRAATEGGLTIEPSINC